MRDRMFHGLVVGGVGLLACGGDVRSQDTTDPAPGGAQPADASEPSADGPSPAPLPEIEASSHDANLALDAATTQAVDGSATPYDSGDDATAADEDAGDAAPDVHFPIALPR